jgi:aspartate/methionine/tyrosine aminotransferase
MPREGDPGDFVSSRTRLIVVTNLHNPTCARFDEHQLTALAETAKSAGARILIDEVYLQCLFDQATTAFHLGNVFVATGSLTKAYGLGGLRCGWILAEPDLCQRMWNMKDLVDPSSVHSKELLSVIALRNLNRLAARAKTLIDTNRALLRDFLKTCPQLDVKVPDYGTCVFPRIKNGDGDRLFDILRNEYDTEVVPADSLKCRIISGSALDGYRRVCRRAREVEAGVGAPLTVVLEIQLAAYLAFHRSFVDELADGDIFQADAARFEQRNVGRTGPAGFETPQPRLAIR